MQKTRTHNQMPKNLKTLFEKENKILVAYLFGSHAKGNQTAESDIDIAVLLSATPKKTLEYHLHLMNELSKVLGNEVDLIILNTAPPMLKHQTIKHGKVIYCRDEKARIKFEARAQSEYLDFSRALARYDECLMKKVLA